MALLFHELANTRQFPVRSTQHIENTVQEAGDYQ